MAAKKGSDFEVMALTLRQQIRERIAKRQAEKKYYEQAGDKQSVAIFECIIVELKELLAHE